MHGELTGKSGVAEHRLPCSCMVGFLTVMRGFASVAVGLVLLSLPLVLLLFAWRFAARRTGAQVAWRERVFAVALIGSGLSCLSFWIAVLILPHVASLEVYEKVGWTSESFSLIFLVCSLAGTGTARVLAALAAAGMAMLWVSVGFW
jgi:hypothetical protein